MRGSVRYFMFTCLLLVPPLIIDGCKPTTDVGDTIVNISDPVSESLALNTQGWNSFEAKNYTGAISYFKQAIAKYDQDADAYNGLGWAYARLDSLEKAIYNFDVALGLMTRIFNGDAGILDAYAGRSFVSLALGKYNEAITSVNAIQSYGVRFYAFRHDVSISLDDLLLVKAQSYFLLANYWSSQQIIDYLDPENKLDPNKPGYIEDLALEIEALWARI